MLSIIKRIARELAPQLVAQVREARHRESGSSEDRPPAEVFGEIYKKNLWGGTAGEFYSGPGSDTEAAAAFVSVVKEYISHAKISSIVDLGCGDFRVGSQLVSPDITYVGIDVVPELVDFNQNRFGNEHIRFATADLINGPLPTGQLYILRQVLQHLSNTQIERVLQRLDGAQHVIIAEHQPGPSRLRSVNIEKPAGKATRIGYRSGVYPDRPPFSRPYRLLTRTPVPPLVASDESIAIYCKDDHFRKT